MSHNHPQHADEASQQGQHSDQVLLQPESTEVVEVPRDKASGILQVISEFKDSGQIPRRANDHHIMMALHQDMLKEQQMVAAYNAALPSGAPLPAHQPSLGSAPQPPPQSGHVSINMGHSHGNVSQMETGSGENLLVTVTNLIQQNPKAINDPDGDGDTLLHRVCSLGQDKLTYLLLVNGANVNSMNTLSQTPFHLAAKSGQILTMQLLSEYGADVNAADVNGWTALHHAAASSVDLSPPSLVYLTGCLGLSMSALTNAGQSVLHIVANLKKDNNRLMLPIMLSSTDLDVSWLDKSGSNAMHYAAEHCQSHMCYKFACKRGAKLLLVTNNAGKTPLDIAKDLPTLEGFALAEAMAAWLKGGENYKPSDSKPLWYYQLLATPLAVLLCSLALAQLLTPRFQGFILLAGFLSNLAFVSRSSVRVDQVTRLMDPSRVGAFILCYSCLAYINMGEYATSRLPEFNRVVLLCCLYLCTLIGGVLYYLLLTRDPGFTYESKRKETGEFYTMKDLMAMKRPSVFCCTCQLIPTRPTKHCKLCEGCVYRMDHHCVYIMRCIGNNNLYIFLWFNITLFAVQLMTLSMLPGYISFINSSGSELNAYLQIFMYDGFLFIVLAGDVGFLLGMTVPLLVRTLYNASNGYTYYFSPHRMGKGHVSALSCSQRIINVLAFLRNGKTIYKDPNYKI